MQFYSAWLEKGTGGWSEQLIVLLQSSLTNCTAKLAITAGKLGNLLQGAVKFPKLPIYWSFIASFLAVTDLGNLAEVRTSLYTLVGI